MKPWNRRTTAPKTSPGAPESSPSSEAASPPESVDRTGEPETALGETLAWFAEATRSTAAPHERESTWCRVEAQIAGLQLAAGGREGARRNAQGATPDRVAPCALRLALSHPGAGFRLAVAIACGLVVLAWGWQLLPRALRSLDAAGTQLAAPREVRLNPALWQRDALAEEPAGDAIDELARVLKP
jgi:hypothetical protein